MLFVLICTALSFAGCADYYAGYPGYGPYYGPGPYYGGGSVVVAVGDRPYYRGPWISVRQQVLPLEAGALGLAPRPTRLDPRPLRRPRILKELLHEML